MSLGHCNKLTVCPRHRLLYVRASTRRFEVRTWRASGLSQTPDSDLSSCPVWAPVRVVFPSLSARKDLAVRRLLAATRSPREQKDPGRTRVASGPSTWGRVPRKPRASSYGHLGETVRQGEERSRMGWLGPNLDETRAGEPLAAWFLWLARSLSLVLYFSKISSWIQPLDGQRLFCLRSNVAVRTRVELNSATKLTCRRWTDTTSASCSACDRKTLKCVMNALENSHLDITYLLHLCFL